MLRYSGFQSHQRHPPVIGRLGQCLPRAQVAEPFDVQADGCNARILQQGPRDGGERGLCHVSTGYRVSNRQGPLLHRQVDRNVGALGENGHAPIHAFASVLIWPEQSAIQSIDEPIAIRAKDRHVACGCNQPGLKIAATGIFARSLGKA